jgi:hypothetical protein
VITESPAAGDVLRRVTKWLDFGPANNGSLFKTKRKSQAVPKSPVSELDFTSLGDLLKEAEALT